ncbi:M24 family metallopeptidase [Nonomuraea sp. NPDC050451]|uniref:M24 family metallopeptidase n=1 Tax=Nonomuraea sp. NPDC050451 TaxID=3364364 RepID=UPI00378C3E01
MTEDLMTAAFTPGTIDDTAVVASTARRTQLREHLLRLDVQGALVYSRRRSAVTWLTGYAPGFISNSAALWLPVDGPPALGVEFPFEVERTRRYGLNTLPMSSPLDLVPDGIDRIGLLAGDLVIDERTPALLDGLASRLIRHVDLAAWAMETRERKTEPELRLLTHAARIGDLALRAAGDTAVVGERDYEIAARVEAAARAAGALRCLCLVGIGDGAVITEASSVTVGRDQQVGLEVSLYASGAFMHVNTTLLPAMPRPVDLRAVGAVRAARAALIDALRPGRAVTAVVAAGDAVLDEHGLLEFKEYDFGHGLGCDTPEHPRLLHETDRTIAAGAVVAVHVAVRRPGGESAMIGGPVVIAEDGAHELVPDAVWA